MTKPTGTRYVPGYDLFKLIVAVILTIILIYLMMEESNRRYALLETTIPSPSPTEMNQSIEPTRTLEPTATPTTESFLPTATASEVAVVVTETPVVESSPEPTITPTEQPTPQDPSTNECPSNPTRIQTGARVTVLDWLNFRTGPGLNYEIQRTNRPGTQMDVIGGPVCTVRGENPPTAYLWWNVRMDSGQEGWSAEAPLNFPNYFLEPTE